MPAMPIAESSAPIVVGIRHTSSATRITTRLLGVGEHRERLERDRRQQEDDGEAGEEDVEGDLIRRLLAQPALNERDHPVDEGLARAGGDAHDDLVRQHPGTAGDRRAVATALPDHRDDSPVIADSSTLAMPSMTSRRSGSTSPRSRRTRRRGRARCSARPRPCRQADAGARRSPSASCGACRPAPCPGPRRSPRRSWRTAR